MSSSNTFSPGAIVNVTTPTAPTVHQHNSNQWELKIPEHVKTQFDLVYLEEIRKYIKENILRQDIVIQAVYPFKLEFGRDSNGLMVIFKPAMEALAGDEK